MQLSRFDPRPEEFKLEDATFELRCLNSTNMAAYQAALGIRDTERIAEILIKYGIGKITGLKDASGKPVRSGFHLWGVLQGSGDDASETVVSLLNALMEKNTLSDNTAKNS